MGWRGDYTDVGTAISAHASFSRIAAQRYLVNAYRELLTRARQGMAIFVPPGDEDDPTRLPEYYDGTFAYLTSVGIECI